MNPKDRKKLEALVWKHTHRDFKGKYADGTKTILKFVPSMGTCSVPIGQLTDVDLVEALPSKARALLT